MNLGCKLLILPLFYFIHSVQNGINLLTETQCKLQSHQKIGTAASNYTY